ncbi:MAG: hypothetical protein RSA08_02830 [Clostridia bacterium]
MGIAALVLGIICIILSFIPFLNIFFFAPAIAGLVLGIVDTIKNTKSRSMGIAGIVLNAISIIMISLSFVTLLVFSSISSWL